MKFNLEVDTDEYIGDLVDELVSQYHDAKEAEQEEDVDFEEEECQDCPCFEMIKALMEDFDDLKEEIEKMKPRQSFYSWTYTDKLPLDDMSIRYKI